jgi:hypothetical protein
MGGQHGAAALPHSRFERSLLGGGMIMRKMMIVAIGSAAVLAGCGKGGTPAEASANVTEAAAPKKVPYCFFTDDYAKDWTASAGEDGNVSVKGKAYVADGRYKAVLKPAEIDGTTASLQLGMPQNDTGHSTRDGWWDVKTTIPDSRLVTKVLVLCGARTEASLDVARSG